MKILVTGGAGFIGSHVVDAYVAAGHEVVVVDDLSNGDRRRVNAAASFRQLDIRDPSLIDLVEAERPAIVNHHAAQASVSLSMLDPLKDAAINVLGSLNVIDCARRCGIGKVIYASTGGAAVGEPEYLPVDEEHPVRPLSPYGAHKHAVEHYLHMYHVNYGLSYTILRYMNVYGPRQDPTGEAGVVAIFASQMLRGEQPTINGSGEQERDMLYVEDVARANLLAIEGGHEQMFHIGSGASVSVNEIFARLAAIIGYSGPPRHGPPLPGEVFKIHADTRKAERELGWRARVGLDEGMARTVEYFRRVEKG